MAKKLHAQDVTPETEGLARARSRANPGDEVEWRGFLSKAAFILSKKSARLAANPADEGVREATIEECAKVADDNASISADGDGEIWIAKKIASCIRALSTSREPKP